MKSLMTEVAGDSFVVAFKLFVTVMTDLGGIGETFGHQGKSFIYVNDAQFFTFRFGEESLSKNMLYKPNSCSTLNLDHSLCIMNVDGSTCWA